MADISTKIVTWLLLQGTMIGILIVLIFLLCFVMLKNVLSERFRYYICSLPIIMIFISALSIVGMTIGKSNGSKMQEIMSTAINPLSQIKEYINLSSISLTNTVGSIWGKWMINLTFLLWIAVVIYSLARYFIRQVRFRRNLDLFLNAFDIKNYFGVQKKYIELYRKLNIRKPPKLLECELACAPMVMGIFHPAICFSKVYAQASTGMTYALCHELIHCQRKDLFFKLCITIVCCVFWFQPLIYLLKNMVERQCELACDEGVIQTLNLDERERAAYARELLFGIQYEVSNAFVKGSVLTLSKQGRVMDQRLTLIVKRRRKIMYRKLISIFSAILLVLVSTMVVFATNEILNQNHVYSEAVVTEDMNANKQLPVSPGEEVNDKKVIAFPEEVVFNEANELSENAHELVDEVVQREKEKGHELYEIKIYASSYDASARITAACELVSCEGDMDVRVATILWDMEGLTKQPETGIILSFVE